MQSINELMQYVSSRENEISVLRTTIKDMSTEMKLMKEDGDQIISNLRVDLER